MDFILPQGLASFLTTFTIKVRLLVFSMGIYPLPPSCPWWWYQVPIYLFLVLWPLIKLLCHHSAFCCCSFIKSCLTLCDSMDHITPGPSVLHYLLSLLQSTSTESVMLSNHLIFSLSLLLLPSVFPGITVFSSESTFCIWQPKYWSFSFSISPSNEFSG